MVVVGVLMINRVCVPTISLRLYLWVGVQWVSWRTLRITRPLLVNTQTAVDAERTNDQEF